MTVYDNYTKKIMQIRNQRASIQKEADLKKAKLDVKEEKLLKARDELLLKLIKTKPLEDLPEQEILKTLESVDA